MVAPDPEVFNAALAEPGAPLRIGIFRAKMLVKIENDGPVTIWLDTATRHA